MPHDILQFILGHYEVISLGGATCEAAEPAVGDAGACYDPDLRTYVACAVVKPVDILVDGIDEALGLGGVLWEFQKIYALFLGQPSPVDDLIRTFLEHRIR
jgi:hypothetical protein